MSFQVGIGYLGGTVFFQVGLCTRLRTISALESLFISILSSILLRYFELSVGDFVLLAEQLLSTLY